eukprot:scaffold2975_cov248-Pinguiococcus_pyrenoidosus.AAC.3
MPGQTDPTAARGALLSLSPGRRSKAPSRERPRSWNCEGGQDIGEWVLGYAPQWQPSPFLL